MCSNFQEPNSKIPMITQPKYDLHERTFKFAKSVRIFCRRVPKDLCNIEDIKQLIKSSGSVGANYIEANESLSTKDFFYRIKVCKKESKESAFWLRLLDLRKNAELEEIRKELVSEASQFVKIFFSIVQKQK